MKRTVVHHAELVTYTLDELVEMTWKVPYIWSPPVPASRVERGYSLGQPAEGGLELDGDPELVELKVFNEDGDTVVTLKRGTDDKALDHADPAKLGADFDACWEAACDHNAERLDCDPL